MVLNPNTTIVAAVGNTLSALLFIYASLRLLMVWRKDRDPLTASLALSIMLMGIGLIFEVSAEYIVIAVGANATADLLVYIFFVFFIASYPLMAYFYVGLFRPRNRWYLPTISFLSGFLLRAILGEEIAYGPPATMALPFAILTLGMYVPLYLACRETAPKASRLLTRMKFILVGRFSLLYIATFFLFMASSLFGSDPVTGNLFFLVVMTFMMVTVLHAWFGWSMPEFLRRRYAEAEKNRPDGPT